MSDTNTSGHLVEVAGAKIHLLKSGSGDAVLSMHSIEGNLGLLPYLDALSQSACVYAPTHPGFGSSERPDWLETIADLARFYLWMLQDLELDKVHLMGGFMGGWVAAEMAVMNPHILQSLTLIGTAGVRPSEGEIADIFLLGDEQTTSLSIGDPDLLTTATEPEDPFVRLRGREMTTRLCWKPYMHSPSLIHLLPRVHVPTLILWGDNDRIVPVSAGERIADAMPDARLEIIAGAGHLPHIERSNEVIPLLQQHMGLTD